MPYDFMSAFSRPGTGFAGRQQGSYFQPYYGSAADVTSVSPATVPPPAMNPQQNFFDQMAGLFGLPPQTGPARGTNPWAAQQALNQWGPDRQINFGNFQSAVSQMPRDQRQVVTPGGMGRFGGVPRDVQESMFRGPVQVSGRASRGRNPLNAVPMPKRPVKTF